ncbi:hypothetical protein [Chroococcidiopsis sp. CCMEE 29]
MDLTDANLNGAVMSDGTTHG